jgi:hypothetical protein
MTDPLGICKKGKENNYNPYKLQNFDARSKHLQIKKLS